MSDIIAVTEATFEQEVIASSVPVIIDFHADWCAPCKALFPGLVDVAREYDGEVKIVQVDIDAETALKDRFGVRGIPMMLIMKSGTELERINGAYPRSVIAAAVERAIGANV